MSIKIQLEETLRMLDSRAELVAVSKTYPASDIAVAYEQGQRRFGESRPQELRAKWEELPKDIEWHMIGHLQRNKVRMIMPFVTMIETLDSERLAIAIDQEAERCERVVDCLLEIHVAQEESKTGWSYTQLMEFVESGGFERLKNIRVRGVMGIASNTMNQEHVRADFELLHSYKEALVPNFGEAFDTLSMGMSHDFMLAVECGSTSVRVGSKIFGYRDYTK